jgi:hypothetical protein
MKSKYYINFKLFIMINLGARKRSAKQVIILYVLIHISEVKFVSCIVPWRFNIRATHKNTRQVSTFLDAINLGGFYLLGLHKLDA